MNRLLGSRKRELLVRFEACDDEPTDAEFYYEFRRYNESSMWICLMFLMTCFIQFSLEIDETIFNIASYREESCIYASLQSIRWKHNESASIFYPLLRKPCMMYNYSIAELSNMTYEDAKKWVAERAKPPVVYCSVGLSSGKFSWKTDFIGTCTGAMYRMRIRSSKLVGVAIGSTVLGVLADLYGRKFSIYIAISLYYCGTIIQQLMNNFTVVALLTVVKGIGKAGLDQIVLVLFLECCSKYNRAILVLYVKMLSPLGTIMGVHMKKHLYGFCPELRFIIGIPSLIFLFYAWYAPESPRWSLSYCRKEEAWTLLHRLGTSVRNVRFLPKLKLKKWLVLRENLTNMFTITKFIKTIFLSIYLLSFLISVENSKKQYTTLKGLLKPYAHHALLTMAQLFSFMYVLPPVIILRRRLALLWFFLLIFILLGINMATTLTIYYILNILMMLSIYSVKSLFILYICEVFPTCLRATAYGFINTLAIVLYFMHYLYELKIRYTTLRPQHVEFFMAALLGLIVVYYLPEVKHEELSDYKRYRRDYEEEVKPESEQTP